MIMLRGLMVILYCYPSIERIKVGWAVLVTWNMKTNYTCRILVRNTPRKLPYERSNGRCEDLATAIFVS